MENKIARIISYIFHPLLMPIYTFAILFSMKIYFASIISLQGKLMIMIFVFLSTFFFPAIFTFFLWRTKMISSLHLEKKEERTMPFLFTIIFYFGSYYMLRTNGIPPIYWFILLASTLMIILAFLINFKFKISIHTMAIGALTGIVIGISYRFGIDMLLPILLLIIIGGLVGFSRLTLNAHRPQEIYSGYLLGLGLMLGLLMLV